MSEMVMDYTIYDEWTSPNETRYKCRRPACRGPVLEQQGVYSCMHCGEFYYPRKKASDAPARKPRLRGRIVLSFSVVCGVCGDEMPTAGRSSETAREEAARLGWTKDLVCPQCRSRKPERFGPRDEGKGQ